mmetsp:Transcript_7070/g.20612  ORF Transcript_7070/g.20612 Transcript_7070/m.20612 type:complete len:493 (-) Transcript_7070:155-1633(-)
MAETAPSCPMTRPCSVSSRLDISLRSSAVSLVTGIPVQSATTSAISASPTVAPAAPPPSYASICSAAPASSIRSIALSGLKRSEMYLAPSSAAAAIAPSLYLTPWYSSYFGLRPVSMEAVSATDGSSTLTAWKRRSSAASFSMYLRYSAIVVAPMHCSSPRASAGLSKLAASMAPSAAPAPTSVWISSMKSTVSLDCVTSSITDLSRSSNSPRYFVSATSRPSSSESTRIPSSRSGASPSTMRCAMPSAIAVLPTPGSPISTGFDLRRRTRIFMQRRTSSARPTHGSSFPSRARCVRSTEHCSRVELPPLRRSPPAPTASASLRLSSFTTAATSTPRLASSAAAEPPSDAPSATALSISPFGETSSAPRPFASSSAARSDRSVSDAKGRSSSLAVEAKSFSRGLPALTPPPAARASSSRTALVSTPDRLSAAATPSRCSVAERSRWSVPMASTPSWRASVCASMMRRIASLSYWSKKRTGGAERREPAAHPT